jgi:hypothetical protein
MGGEIAKKEGISSKEKVSEISKEFAERMSAESVYYLFDTV